MNKGYSMMLEAKIQNLRKDNLILKEQNSKYSELEEQLGCPLEVVAQALSRGFYIDVKKVEIDPPLKSQTEDLLLINCPKDFRLNLWYERIEVASFGHYLEIYLKDYKNTWWLKKDKSE